MDEYFVIGGFPELVMSNLDSRGYFELLFDSLLFKDVVKSHKLKFSTEIGNLDPATHSA